VVPDDNPMSEEKVELGRRLFYDTRLSANGTQACASCHLQALGFSDGRVTPVGSTGQAVPRNAPGLANVAYYSTYTWANPVLETLEAHALVPLTADAPLELGAGGALEEVLGRLRGDARLAALARVAFPGEAEPLTLANVARALAAFQRTLLSFDAPYDRYLRGDTSALSESARRGLKLFFEEKAECYHCHSGPHLTSSFRSATSRLTELQYENIGLYNVGGTGAYPAASRGILEFTGRAEDMGRFRVPSLRNVARTAPYMHDGSVASLREVVDLYARGGRLVREGPYAGDGRDNPYKNSTFVRPVRLEPQEREDLVAFLESLTDEAFLTEPRFGPPQD
jgi:cytochrome c peroxidase